MVIRGLGAKRLDASVRKLKNSLRAAGETRKLYNAFRRGDSLTAMTRRLRAAGVSVSPNSLKGLLANRFSFAELANFDRVRLLAGGARSGFSLAPFVGLYQPRDILVRVRMRLGSGEIRTFQRYVTNYEGQTLDDIYGEIELSYGESNMDSDTTGEILDISLATGR